MVNRAAVVLAALALFALVARAEVAEVTHITPPPQPPLADADQDTLASLRDAFNDLSDRPRVVAMLSPT